MLPSDKKQCGMILPIVLLFIQIILMMTSFLVHAIVTEAHLNQLYAQQITVDLSNEMILAQIEKIISATQSCFIPVMLYSERIKRLTDSSQTKICSGNFSHFKYYYVIESIRLDECAYVADTPAKIAEYLRLTVLIEEPFQGSQRILETTWINPVSSNKSCQSAPYMVKAGRQSWYETE